ncbi:MAG: group II intron maturase-specific domain-containing protein [Rhodospirillales bacterium]
MDRAKDRLRQITRRNRGIPLARMIDEVNAFTTGWVTYFRHAEARMKLRTLDQWLRRKLRCVRLKQCKRTWTIADFLRGCGVPERYAWMLALSGKGWWRLAGSPQATRAMPIAWFDSLGLVRLENHYLAVNAQGNRRGTGTYARWCERGEPRGTPLLDSVSVTYALAAGLAKWIRTGLWRIQGRSDHGKFRGTFRTVAWIRICPSDPAGVVSGRFSKGVMGREVMVCG